MLHFISSYVIIERDLYVVKESDICKVSGSERGMDERRAAQTDEEESRASVFHASQITGADTINLTYFQIEKEEADSVLLNFNTFC